MQVAWGVAVTMTQRIASLVLLAASCAEVVVGCGSDDYAGRPSGAAAGTGGSAGADGGGTGGGTAGSGGSAGTTGSGGAAGAGDAGIDADAGSGGAGGSQSGSREAMDLVSGGTVMTSSNHRLILTTGQG